MADGEEVAVADAGDRAVPPAPGRMPIGSNGAVETGAGAALDGAGELALRGPTRLAKSVFGETGAAAAIRLAASGQRIMSAAEAGIAQKGKASRKRRQYMQSSTRISIRHS